LNKPDIFRKVSHTEIGKKYIYRENQGIQWYSNLISKPSNLFIKDYYENGNYSRLDLNRIKGKRMDYNSSLTKNEMGLNLCIEHYNDLWPDNKIVPCHGDLTLDNVFFSGSKITFFDWEHFFADGEKWGFDIAYLLLSAAYLPYHMKNRLPVNDQLVFKKLWYKICENGLSDDIAKTPFDYFRNRFCSVKHWSEIVSHSPNKLFPIWSNKSFNNYIHDIINI
tara:strand:+ start:172 stop:837 length:666 start_codon:yes stop_codon:yes gene_type:complete